MKSYRAHPAAPDCPARYAELMASTLVAIERAAPAIRDLWYLAGTTPVSVEHLGARVVSVDLDFRTREAFGDIFPEVEAISDAHPGRLDVFQADREFGMMSGQIRLPGRPPVHLDIFCSDEDVPDRDVAPCRALGDFPAATLDAYLRGKADCLSHRLRPKDLYHVACVSTLPGWAGRVQATLGGVPPESLLAVVAETRRRWKSLAREALPFGPVPGMDRETFMGWIGAIEGRAARGAGLAQAVGAGGRISAAIA